MKIDLRKLKHLFWDTDISKIDPQKNKYFIIERVLRYGFGEDVKLIISAYSKDDIVHVVKTSRVIDRKTARYWSIHFDIPEKEILCLNRQLPLKYSH